jgi:hypothetical protein
MAAVLLRREVEKLLPSHSEQYSLSLIAYGGIMRSDAMNPITTYLLVFFGALAPLAVVLLLAAP